MIHPSPQPVVCRHIFGPVPSRRLGFSLGVDIIPYKTCSFDCLYCELGVTTRKTVEPVGDTDPETVLRELERTLAEAPPLLDVVTVTGSGEPTLHPRLGLLIEEIKKRVSVPVALLTNGSLLFKDEVLEAVLKADLVLPSLDASDESVFQAVNRPHPDLSFPRLLEGLIRLGRSRGPKVWLEVLFLEGMNDDPRQVEQMNRWIEEINPEKVQINTVVRPPAEGSARPLPIERLTAIQRMLGPRSEVVAAPPGDKAQPAGRQLESKILEMVARRPCTSEDITRSLGIPEGRTVELLERLTEGRKIRQERFQGRCFYRILHQH